MPHVTLEYSANLDRSMSMDALCEAVLETVLASGVFEVGAVRVRAIRCDDYAIADRDHKNAFLDGTLRLGAGRDAETKKAVGQAIFDTMRRFFEDRLAEDYFALSFEVREIDPDLSFKTNSMHRRLRDPA